MLTGSDIQLTHFGPEKDKPMLAQTAQSIPVILSFFETLLGSQYPYPSLQQAFIPCGFSPVASAGLQILPTSLLFTERCVEQVKCHEVEASSFYCHLNDQDKGLYCPVDYASDSCQTKMVEMHVRYINCPNL